MKDCPLLVSVAEGVVKACAPLGVPVTAKIRIGWDMQSINAPVVAKMLEEAGIAAIAVHGRTRSQGYTGEADWQVIDSVARAVRIPVVGNGDVTSAADVMRRRAETAVAGVMIGRAAMRHPWIFREAKQRLEGGAEPASVSLEEKWALILRHTREALAGTRYGSERQTMQFMRTRYMAYSHGLPFGKRLRARFSTVQTMAELEEVAADSLAGRIAGEAFAAVD